MRYSIAEKYNCVVITFKGDIIGGPKGAKFHDEIKSLTGKGKTNVIGDLSKVKFMNSSGLGIFITAMTSLRKEGGDFKLCGASKRIQSLLMVTKLITVFDNYKTLDEAVAAYQDDEADNEKA